ncbi:EAL domain-containing protein [Neptunomonas japonica]|uniref:EAL domain-containing protein n=1 Tax=Neptunomonas japonica TaxID=417574 RepID=UPI0019152797
MHFSRPKTTGALLAIDDIGTNYSPFASLKHLDVVFLKIDKHCIDSVLTGRRACLPLAQ